MSSSASLASSSRLTKLSTQLRQRTHQQQQRQSTPAPSPKKPQPRSQSQPPRPQPQQSAASILRDAVLAYSTIKRYKRSLHLFITWCDENGVVDSSNMDELDSILCSYIEHLYNIDKSKKTWALNALNAVQHFHPRSKSLLPESHLLVRGWARMVPKLSRPPLTFELAVVIAVSMLKAGFYRPAVATILAFECYLRVGELCAIRVRDVALISGRHFGQSYIGSAIGLVNTKTGPNQFVTIRTSFVDSLIEQLVTDLTYQCDDRDQLLFDFSSDTYRKHMQSACSSLGLSQYNFSPHSLRHGGATYSFMSNVPIEDILLRGRWRQPLSARTYIQSGPMLMIQVNQPQLQLIGANFINNPKSLIATFNFYRLKDLF